MSTVAAYARFELVHPSVLLVYGALILVIAMLSMQPPLAAMLLAATVCLGAVLEGWRASMRRLAWQLPLVFVVALANCMFSQAGATVLLEAGFVRITLESLIYGLCFGCILASVMELAVLLGSVVSGDEALSLLGNRLPTCGLMVSSALRLVPLMRGRAIDITEAAAACTCANKCRGSENPSHRLSVLLSGHRRFSRTLSVLIGVAMEDSIDMADSMRARGWSRGGHRTLYRRRAFRAHDALLLFIVLVLGVGSLWVCLVVGVESAFYPTLVCVAPTLGNLWYMPYVAFLLAPFLMLASLAIRRRSV